MKIIKQEGCICDSLNIDGIEEVNMTNIQLDILPRMNSWDS